MAKKEKKEKGEDLAIDEDDQSNIQEDEELENPCEDENEEEKDEKSEDEDEIGKLADEVYDLAEFRLFEQALGVFPGQTEAVGHRQLKALRSYQRVGSAGVGTADIRSVVVDLMSDANGGTKGEAVHAVEHRLVLHTHVASPRDDGGIVERGDITVGGGEDAVLGVGGEDAMLDIAPQHAHVGAEGKTLEGFPTHTDEGLMQATLAIVIRGTRNLLAGAVVQAHVLLVREGVADAGVGLEA